MSDEDQFYELNAQCWRCRMYVPRAEMKYYGGLLYCPICYQDIAEAGGRCQLCGKYLEHGGGQICSECKEKKKQQGERCARCGAVLEGGVCNRCSRGEPWEPGVFPRGGDEGGRPSGPGIVVCSKCRQHAESPVWQGGQPYCQICAEKGSVFLPIMIVQRLNSFVKRLIRPKETRRLRLEKGKTVISGKKDKQEEGGGQDSEKGGKGKNSGQRKGEAGK